MSASEEHYRLLFERNQAGVFRITIDGRILDWNPAMAGLFGYSAQEAKGINFEVLYPTPAERKACVDKLLAEKSVTSLEVCFRRKDGTPLWTLFSASLVQGTGGEPEIEGTLLDITELKRAGEALRERENLLRTIIESEPECVKLMNPNGELIQMNSAGLAMIEADSFEQVKGRCVYPNVAPKQRPMYQKLTEGVFQGTGGKLEFEFVGLRGGRRWLETTEVPLRDGTGKVTAALGITRDITERKRAEEALRASEERFRTLVVASAEVVWNADSRGEPIGENLSWRQFTGQTLEEIRNGRWAEAIHPDDWASLGEVVSRAYAQGVPYKVENRLRRFDGEWRHMFVHGVPIIEEDGTVREWIGYCHDITDRKKAEEAVTLFRSLIEHTNDGIEVIDAETGRFLNVNEKACLGHGYTREEFLALTLPEIDPLVTAQSWEKTKAELRRLGCRTVESLHRRKDGSEFPVEVNVSYVSLDRDYLLAVVRDITERKRAEVALRASEARFRTIYENAPVMMDAFDKKGRCIMWNKECEKTFGWTMEEINSHDDPLSLFYPDPKIRDQVKETVTSSPEMIFREWHPQTKDGIVLTCMWANFGLPDGTVMNLGYDITERKHAEKALQQLLGSVRALAAHLQNIREEERTRIAREIHDELGQALTAIKFDLASFVRDRPVNQKQMAGRVEPVIRQLDETIQSVRRISTELRPSILEKMGLAAGLEWAGEEFETRTGIKCRVNAQKIEDTDFDQGRSIQIFRIAQEALTNVARHANATHVRIGLAKQDGNLTLEIQDDGSGIRPEQIESASSLGLLGMRERTLALGGVFQISGSPGEGTTVKISIRVEQASTGG